MQNQSKNFKILDCTIRDGGYLNNWEFEPKLVKEVYRNLSRSGIEYVEIGLRNKKIPGVGLWYHTPEDTINELLRDISGVGISLLIDEGKADIASFPLAKDSLVKLYRVACHKNRIQEGLQECEAIKAKGYEVSIQLMGINSYSMQDMNGLIKPLAQSSVDYVYFADSYGTLFPRDIKHYVEWLKPAQKRIGFHPHNNLQLAFANTLEAIHEGVDIVDGTIYGMGRGAGNLPLEVLITYLERNSNNKKYNVLPVLDLIVRHFDQLSKDLGWGYNLPYMLSGAYSVHPNYATYLMDYHEYKAEDIVKVFDVINKSNVVKYDEYLVKNIINSGFVRPQDEFEQTRYEMEELKSLSKKFPVSYHNRHEGKDFLILANGPSITEYQNDIQKFIDKNKPVTIGVNFLGDLFAPDYHLFSNSQRFTQYIDQVHKYSKLLLSTSFEEDFIKDYTARPFEWVAHLNRVASDFDIVDNVVTTNCRTVAMLAVAAAVMMGAKRIFIAGLDGYNISDFEANKTHFYPESAEANDFKILSDKHYWNEQLLQSISTYLTDRGKEGLHIITPTNYKSFYNSIYNYQI